MDNFCEFKRSPELPEYLAKTYETNMLINVAEYVTLLSQDQFIYNEVVIKATLADISKAYLFNDLGYTLKNSMNWGCRDEDTDHASLVILDYGYFYSLAGQDLERLFTCPKCGQQLEWNASYTHFECSNRHHNCSTKMSPGDIRNRMLLDLEDQENEMLAEIANSEAPDFTNYEQYIAHIIKQEGQ